MTANTPTPAATAPDGRAHTPTPWARTGLVVHREHSHAAAVIADCNYVGGTYDMNMANAAHIAHCVNTHSQLLVLLREWFDASDPSIGGTPDSLLERTRAALKLVTP